MPVSSVGVALVRLPQVNGVAVSGNVALWLAESRAVGTWLALDLRTSPHKGGLSMAIRIEDNFMVVEADGTAAATARFSRNAAADGNGAWAVSTCPARLLGHDQAIRALTVAELLEIGYPDDAPIVVALREELR
jgi:hypothetical protein